MCRALGNLAALLVLSLYRHLTPTLPFVSRRLHFARRLFDELVSFFFFSFLFFSIQLCRLRAFVSLCLMGVREHKGKAGLLKNKRRRQEGGTMSNLTRGLSCDQGCLASQTGERCSRMEAPGLLQVHISDAYLEFIC